MKGVKVFLSLVFVVKIDSRDLYSYAIHEVVENHFANKSINHNVIAYGATDELLRDVLSFRSERFSRKIMNWNFSMRVNESAILLFDSMFSLNMFNIKVQFKNNLLTPLNFLVVFTIPVVEENIEIARYTPVLQSQLIIARCEETFCLYTFKLYSSEKCRAFEKAEVNRFSRKTGKWMSNDFFPTDRNFHGCEIAFGVPKTNPPSTDWIIQGNKTQIFGFSIDIIDSLAVTLNFTIKYILCFGVGRDCFSPTQYDLFGSGYQTMQNKNFGISAALFSTEITFVIPLGEPYTPFEKLILPFDSDVWMWFLTFMGVGIVVIFIVNFTPKPIQTFVFGRGVETPTLNLFQAFFGIGQISLPDGSFARYLLMMFILFCLVMRTAYQGIMFNFMQAEMRKPEVQSIKEMIDKKFTFKIGENIHKMLEKMEIMNGANYENFTYREREFFFKNVSDPTRKLNLLTSRDDALFWVEKLRDEMHLSVLKETLYSDNIGLAFPTDQYNIYDPFNEEIVKLIEGGIVNHWLMKYPELAHRKIQEESEPQVFGLGQLSIGFEIWLGCLAVSFSVFVLEHFYALLQRWRHVPIIAPSGNKIQQCDEHKIKTTTRSRNKRDQQSIVREPSAKAGNAEAVSVVPIFEASNIISLSPVEDELQNEKFLKSELSDLNTTTQTLDDSKNKQHAISDTKNSNFTMNEHCNDMKQPQIIEGEENVEAALRKSETEAMKLDDLITEIDSNK